MSDFNKGDQVQLISGGPTMTVAATGNYATFSGGPQDGVKCNWFDGKGDLREQIFDAAVLEHYKPIDMSSLKF